GPWLARYCLFNVPSVVMKPKQGTLVHAGDVRPIGPERIHYEEQLDDGEHAEHASLLGGCQWDHATIASEQCRPQVQPSSPVPLVWELRQQYTGGAIAGIEHPWSTYHEVKVEDACEMPVHKQQVAWMWITMDDGLWQRLNGMECGRNRGELLDLACDRAPGAERRHKAPAWLADCGKTFPVP